MNDFNQLKRFAVFKGLEDFQLEKLRSRGSIRFLEKDEVFHTPLEICQSAGFILQGNLRMSKIFTSGKELVLRYLDQGEMYGELICFSRSTYPCWIAASEKSVVFEIPAKDLYTLFQEEKFLLAFMSNISQKSLHLTDTIEILSFKKVEEKIAYLVLSLAERKGSDTVSIGVTVGGLAQKLGSSRESVSRALTSMENKGLFLRERDVIILKDKERLEELLSD